MSAGDTLDIESGTYNEQVNINNLVGSANAVTTVQNYNGGIVIIDGSGLTVSSALIYIGTCSYLTLSGLTVQNTTQGIAALWGRSII